MKYFFFSAFLFIFSFKSLASVSEMELNGQFYRIQAAAEVCGNAYNAASGLPPACGLLSDPDNNYHEYHWSVYTLLSNPGVPSYVNSSCEQEEINHGGNLESCTQHNYVAYVDKNSKPDQCDVNPRAGNPVNVLTGVKTQREIDYQPSNGLFVPIVRTYETVWILRGGVKGFWKFEIASRLIPTPLNDGNADIFIRRANGHKIGFYGNTNDGYTSDPDVTERLSFSNGQFHLTLDNDDIESYGFNGRLESIRRRSGYQLNFQYESPTSTQLVQVSDTLGHSMEFNYAGFNIISITDLAGQLYKYEYNPNGMLEYVIFPDETPDETDNPRKQYHYEMAGAPTFLTGITDENGNRFATWAYQSSLRATLSEHAGGVESTSFNYVPSEPKVTVTNAKGKQTSYHYKLVHGRKVVEHVEGLASVDCPGSSKFITYDANGFVNSKTDNKGNVTNYTYNSRGLQTSRTEAVGTLDARTITTEWHSTFRLPEKITTPRLIIDFDYDANGNLTTRTETDTTGVCISDPSLPQCKRITSYTYNSIGQVLTIDGPRTDVIDKITFEYDSLGNRTKIINALSHTTEITSFDTHGNPLSITNPNGFETNLTYDARQRIKSRTVAAGTTEAATTSFTYDAVGKLATITLPNSTVITYIFDAAQRLVSVEDTEGNKIEYTLDLLGNRTETKIKDPQGILTQQQSALFDSLGRLVQAIDANSSIQAFAYDGNDNMIVSTDAKSNPAQFEYDSLNRLIKTIEPALPGESACETLYSYDTQDNLTSITDAEGKTTSYVYNGFGEVLTQNSPDTGLTTYSYDETGNLKTQTNARGITTVYFYDELNRLTTQHNAFNGENIVYEYDEANTSTDIGRLARILHPNGAIHYFYDARGNLSYQVDAIMVVNTPRIFTTQYIYNTSNQLIQTVYPSGRKVNRAYDSNGRLAAMVSDFNSQNQAFIHSIQYDPFNGPNALTFGNALTETRSYDLNGLLENHNLPNVQDRSLNYDLNNNLNAITDNLNANNSHNYAYDVLDRLNTAQNSSGNFDYSYDLIGNRLSETQDGQTDIYNYKTNNHHLDNINTTTTFQYDSTGIGNITQINNDTFSYNAQNRLGQSTVNGITATYLYNPLGQRILKTSPSTGTTLFIYDTQGQLLAEADAGGQILKEYAYFNGQPLTQMQGNSIYYYHNDHLGTPQLLTDQSQQIVWQASYNPFGEATITTATVENNIRFPGQYLDSETNLHYNWNRYYDPSVGRYITSDPIGLDGGINTYGYARQNPIYYTDPDGLAFCGGACVAGIVIGVIRVSQVAVHTYRTYRAVKNAASLAAAVQAIEQSKDCEDESDKDCDQEWENAREFCDEIAAKNGYGGGWSVSGNNYQQCLMGQVSEQCGGNKIEYGASPKKRSFKF